MTSLPPRNTTMNQPLTIFQVSSHNSMERGGSIQMFRLSRGLKQRGHIVHCMMNSANAGQSKLRRARNRFDEAGLSLEFFDMRRLVEIRRFRALVKLHRPQVIHVHREEALRFVWLATLGIDIPCFVTNRGTVYRPKKKTLEWFLLKSRKLKRSICVAEAVKREVLKQVGLPEKKAVVIYGGIDPEEFSPRQPLPSIRPQLGIAESDAVILQVGALIPKKGIDYLLDAFQRLHEDRPNLKLVLLGGGNQQKVSKYLHERKLEKHVLLTGLLEHVAPYYAAADVVVSTATRGEGLTGTLREALLMERSVVSTAIAGNPEMVQHQKSGLLVPPADPVALADAIAWMLDHPSEGAEMAAAGRQWILQNCEESFRSAKVEAVYQEVLAQRK